jgi:hypothetical protein
LGSLTGRSNFDQHRVVDTSLAPLRAVLLALEAAGDPDAVTFPEALGGFARVGSECRGVDVDDAGLAPTSARATGHWDPHHADFAAAVA